MWYYIHQVQQAAGHLNKQAWFLVLVATVVVGMICLRGFGSRSGY